MLTRTQAEEFIGLLIRTGEDLDAVDMTVFYAWLFSAYYSLEPFPQLHTKFRERCLDSFSPANQRLTAGLTLLRKALFKTKEDGALVETVPSPEYMLLLEKAFRPTADWDNR